MHNDFNYGIDAALSIIRRNEMIDLARIIQIESSANPNEPDSPTGAIGLCQIKPVVLVDFNRKTGKRYDLDDLRDPLVSIEVCEWFLTKEIPYLLSYYGFQESTGAILFCYSEGIGTYRKWKAGKIGMPAQAERYKFKYEHLMPKENLTQAREWVRKYRIKMGEM